MRDWGLSAGLSIILSDPLSEPLASFEGLQAEECGILNGCENGRCVRVQEGYTCDCFEGFQLDAAHMACVGKFGAVRMTPTVGRSLGKLGNTLLPSSGHVSR